MCLHTWGKILAGVNLGMGYTLIFSCSVFIRMSSVFLLTPGFEALFILGRFKLGDL